jgi:hypothetical protein
MANGVAACAAAAATTPAEMDAAASDSEPEDPASSADAPAAPQLTEEMRATLLNVQQGMASQLATIQQEMERLRAELGSESGVGGIRAEIDRLQNAAADLRPALGSAQEETLDSERRTTREQVVRARGPHRRPVAQSELRQRQAELRRRQNAVRTSWTPYIVVLFLMLIGPLRPLLLSLWRDMELPSPWPAADAGAAWYDQVDD